MEIKKDLEIIEELREKALETKKRLECANYMYEIDFVINILNDIKEATKMKKLNDIIECEKVKRV